MKLLCTDTARGSGGAVFFSSVRDQCNPTINGCRLLLVGDRARCPHHKGRKTSVILEGSTLFTVCGRRAAYVGAMTSCGHRLKTSGCNLFVQVSA